MPYGLRAHLLFSLNLSQSLPHWLVLHSPQVTLAHLPIVVVVVIVVVASIMSKMNHSHSRSQMLLRVVMDCVTIGLVASRMRSALLVPAMQRVPRMAFHFEAHASTAGAAR